MHQTIDTSGQTDKHAEVGDRLDRALDAVTTLGVLCKFLPGIGFALLHAQRDATFVFVDFQNHHFNLIAQCNDLAGGDVLVGPVHFTDVHQTFDAGLEFHKSAVVSDVGDLAEHARALRVAAVDAHPGIVAHLLEAERYTVLFGIKLQDLGRDFLTSGHHLTGVTHTAPCHVGDVQQTVNTTEVDEGAVFGDVLDNTLNDGTFLEGVHQLGALFAHAGFDHRAARQNDIVALAVKLDDLEFERLVFVGRQVFGGAGVNQRTRQEGADAIDQHGEATLDFAAGGTGNELAGFQCFLQAHPGSQALGRITAQDGVAVTVFDRANGDRNEVANLNFDFALVTLEFFERHIGLGLEASVDNNKTVLDANHFSSDNFAWTHLGALQGFFKKGGKRF